MFQHELDFQDSPESPPHYKPERRKNMGDRESLVTALACAVREEIASLTVPEELHREHHEFIRTWIAKQQRKDERWDKIKTQVGGWAIIAFLGGIGKAMYDAAILIKDHWK